MPSFRRPPMQVCFQGSTWSLSLAAWAVLASADMSLCPLSCPHHSLERQCGIDLLLGLSSNAVSLVMSSPWVDSHLCVPEHKAHISAFLIVTLETSTVAWAACHLYSIGLCVAHLE